MAEKPITITLTPTATGAYTLAPGAPATGGNPFEAGSQSSAMVPASQAQMTGYRAQLPNGQWISFASEADFLKADAFVRSMQQQGPTVGGGGPMLGGSGGTGNAGAWLRTGAEAADTVVGFLQGRALDRKIDDLDRTHGRLDAAQARLEALRSAHPDLVPVLLELLEAEREATITAQEVLEDEISAVDIRTGAGVAKVVSQFMNGGSSSSGNSAGTALAVGGAGLGLGLLLSRDSRGRRRR